MKRIIVIVNAANARRANTEAEKIDMAGGAYTFTVPLSAAGNNPASHYWCSWSMPDADEAAFRGYIADLVTGGNATIINDTFDAEVVLSRIGLQRIGHEE